MAKIITTGPEASKKMLKGIEMCYEAVKSTLGPNGKFAIIEKPYSTPKVTKDGVSVAREIESDNKTENLGIQLFQEVANKTDTISGDGTTTTVVLCYHMVKEASKMAEAGYLTFKMCRGMQQAAKDAVDYIAAQSKPISGTKDLQQVATISANNDEKIGKLVAQAVEKAGAYGIVNVESSTSTETTIKVEEGLKLDSGYASAQLINNDQNECVLEKPLIFMTKSKLEQSDMMTFSNILQCALDNKKPILILAEDIDENLIWLIVYNRARSGLKAGLVKLKLFAATDAEKQTLIDDYATAIGAKVYDKDLDPELADSKSVAPYLGSCAKVVSDAKKTAFIGFKGDISKRSAELKAQIDKLTEENKSVQSEQERYSMLNSCAAVIKVGGASESEVNEKKDRVVDAVNATKLALEMGTSVGGGLTFYHAHKHIKTTSKDEDYAVGYNVVKLALAAPIKTIIENSGLNSAAVLKDIDYLNKSEAGFNAIELKVVEDLKAEGILDATGVCINAVNVATSVAQIALSTCVAIAQSNKKKLD